MHSLRSIARVVLLVLLATLFSPTFGWEAAAGMAAHGHDASASAHEAHHGDAAAHDVAGGDSCHGHDQAAGGDPEHHCCPGHIFGHLTGGLGAALQLPVLPAGKSVVDGTQQRFSSRIPEGLERPPRPAA